jgi:hypothetical protein
VLIGNAIAFEVVAAVVAGLAICFRWLSLAEMFSFDWLKANTPDTTVGLAGEVILVAEFHI